jgi:hypothetical protein
MEKSRKPASSLFLPKENPEVTLTPRNDNLRARERQTAHELADAAPRRRRGRGRGEGGEDKLRTRARAYYFATSALSSVKTPDRTEITVIVVIVVFGRVEGAFGALFLFLSQPDASPADTPHPAAGHGGRAGPRLAAQHPRVPAQLPHHLAPGRRRGGDVQV